ncbi:MAG: hypothetical protein Q7S37_00650 [bacterium]|nr:hypothetical protein [bacterium]
MKKVDLEKFIKKIEASKDGKLDLSSDEDLSIAIMNLVSIEEHFFFTGAKTGKSDYFDLLSQTRQIRTELLKKIITDYEGEVWCISKHLLAASMRLMEVGTKQQAKGNKKEAQEMFEKAFNLYSLFWGINLKVLDVSDIKKIDDNQLNKKDTKKNSYMARLGELVKRAIDCCIE